MTPRSLSSTQPEAGIAGISMAETLSRGPLTHRVAVVAAEQLTPNMRRITFAGDTLATLNVSLLAQWLKVVLAGPEENVRPNRAYTIRHFDPARLALTIDFVLHGDGGPASRWARHALVGDVVHLGSPRGGHLLDPDARWRLLAGDETALPAIGSILDALPADTVPAFVVVEVPSIDDVQPLRASAAQKINWLPRATNSNPAGCLLEQKISSLAFPSGPGQIFLAAESTAVRRIKQDLARRVPQANMDAKGYWLLGQADHKDKS